MPVARGLPPLVATLGLVAVCAWLPSATGQEAGSVFQLWTTEGENHQGSISLLSAAGDLTLTADKTRTYAVRQWLTLRRDKVVLPAHPTAAQVVFANGDRVPVAADKRIRLADSRLQFEPLGPLKPQSSALAPPLASVAVLWLGGSEEAEETADGLRELLASQRKKDIVVLKDGERMEGTVMALDSDKGCRLQAGKAAEEVPWANIAAIAFSSELLFTALPKQPHYHLVLSDGTRLALATARLDKDAKELAATTLSGEPVGVALADILALDVRCGAATYLSDLKPSTYDHKPFLGVSWPLVPDGSVAGRELRLAGSTFDKGLGLHAESRVSYDLARKYRWFEARVGLDPQDGRRGRVRIRVLVDGNERDIGWTKELTFRDEPLVLRVDVSEGRELTLEVLCGTYGDVQAHVNWVDARLVE